MYRVGDICTEQHLAEVVYGRMVELNEYADRLKMLRVCRDVLFLEYGRGALVKTPQLEAIVDKCLATRGYVKKGE
jgi:hypothetical protein